MKIATPRQKFGLPYSSLAIDCSVSPSEMRWVRRAWIEPDVGIEAQQADVEWLKTKGYQVVFQLDGWVVLHQG